MTRRFFFIRKGIHTHLLLPADSVLARIPALASHAQSHPWLRIGWGDRRYFGAPDQNIWLALRALLLPTSASLEVCPVSSPDSHDEGSVLYAIDSGEALFESLLNYVSCFFLLDGNQQLIAVRDKQASRFFRARGVYMALNTCNNWTARALRLGGLPLAASWQFLPGQLERKIVKLGYQPYRHYPDN